MDKALENAILDDNEALAARLQAIKGTIRDDESLLNEALQRAEASDDGLAEAYAAHQYGQYLGKHGQFEKSLVHVARAVDLLGSRGEHLAFGEIYRALGNRDEADAAFRRSLDEHGVAFSRIALAQFHLAASPSRFSSANSNAVLAALKAWPASPAVR